MATTVTQIDAAIRHRRRGESSVSLAVSTTPTSGGPDNSERPHGTDSPRPHVALPCDGLAMEEGREESPAIVLHWTVVRLRSVANERSAATAHRGSMSRRMSLAERSPFPAASVHR